MFSRIMGFILTVWGGAILIKNFIIAPTIFTTIQVYGLTPYMQGQVFALVVAFGMLYLGLRWLVASFHKKPVVQEEQVS